MYQSAILFSQAPLSADTHSPVCLLILTLMCPNRPSLHCPPYLHAHKSFCLLCKEDFPWNVSSKEIIPYLDGLVCCPMKTLALRCSSYQEFPSDLNCLPLICPSLSIDFMTDLSVFVFTLRLQTSQHGPGGKVLHLSPQNIWSQVSCLVIYFFFSALPHGKWDLSSWTKGWTHTCPSTPCHGKPES